MVPRADQGLSVLTLEPEVLDDTPDWPVLRIRVNGDDPFLAVAKDWHGFDPGVMLGPRSPLRPVGAGRRVALYRCSCGEAGCGVIAPVVVASPDGKRISWVDFRDYVGEFCGPLSDDIGDDDGMPWRLRDIHFERDQYLAEVDRASSDRSWETPRRQTARLLHERIEPMGLVLPPDLALAWVEPAWADDGVTVMFERLTRHPTYDVQQQRLSLTSNHADPTDAAADMADQLLAVAPDDWVPRFGHPGG